MVIKPRCIGLVRCPLMVVDESRCWKMLGSTLSWAAMVEIISSIGVDLCTAFNTTSSIAFIV